MEKIIIEGIEIIICKKRIKNLYIRIQPPMGRVCISAPQRMSLREIQQFAKSKMDWIRAHREKFKKNARIQLSYITGESILFRGNSFKLQTIHSEKTKIEITGERIYLFINENSTVEQREKAVREWYRKMMKQELLERVEKWRKIIGVQISGVGIKDMKTRWGSCNVKTRKIWLSLRLIQKTPILMEYVIVHELVHLLEKSHNRVFKGYMDQFLPHWKTLRKELNEGANSVS